MSAKKAVPPTTSAILVETVLRVMSAPRSVAVEEIDIFIPFEPSL